MLNQRGPQWPLAGKDFFVFLNVARGALGPERTMFTHGC